MNEYVTDGHLGGYVRGGDEATWYPDLWTAFVEDLGVRSVLDVGCGEGRSLAYFRELGCRVKGIEGIAQPDPDIEQHDFTEGMWYSIAYQHHGGVDLAWCCEFVEHVEEQYVSNFLKAFSYARMVAMTHAEPGQGGYHHVNCQPAEYWIEKMLGIGYDLDTHLTQQTRVLARKNPSPWNHYARSGLVFRKP